MRVRKEFMLLGRVKKDIKLLGEKSEIPRVRVRKEVSLLAKLL